MIDNDNDTDLLSNITAALSDGPDLSVTPEPTPEPEIPETIPEVKQSTDLFKVKVDGEEREVTLEELKNGYQRQSDYTRKTQELSQERQAIQTKEQEYSQYLQSIPMLAQVAQSNIVEATTRLYDPEFIKLAETDPAQFISEKAKLERIIHQNQSAAQSMANQYQEYQQNMIKVQEEAYKSQLAKSNEILSKEIEGWADGTAIQPIADYGLSLGFTKQELESIIDHRQAIVLNKARLYDEIMKNQNVAAKRVQSMPSKVLTPGVPNTSQEQDDFIMRRNAALSSNDDFDIARVLSELL